MAKRTSDDTEIGRVTLRVDVPLNISTGFAVLGEYHVYNGEIRPGDELESIKRGDVWLVKKFVGFEMRPGAPPSYKITPIAESRIVEDGEMFFVVHPKLAERPI